MLKRSLISSLIVILLLSLQSCSLISITQKPPLKINQSDAPREKLMSFDNQRALSAGATLNSTVAAKVYYKGTEAESKDAKTLWDMSYRFMALSGVNNDFDPTDPESLKKVFEKADGALKQKNKDLADVRQKMQDFQVERERDQKLMTDKVAKAQLESKKWGAKFGSLFYGIIIFIVLLLIGAFVIQLYTGIPIFTGLFNGGLKTMGKLVHQTVAGVENFRNKNKTILSDEKATEEQKSRAKEILDTFGTMMNNVQDLDVRDHVTKLKAHKSVVKNLYNKRERDNNGRQS